MRWNEKNRTEYHDCGIRTISADCPAPSRMLYFPVGASRRATRAPNCQGGRSVERNSFGFDIRKFEVFVSKFLPKLTGYLRGYRSLSLQDVEDIVNETFTRVWDHFDPCRHNASLKGLSIKIAKNLSFDCLRKKRRKPRTVPLLAQPDKDPALSSDKENPEVSVLEQERETARKAFFDRCKLSPREEKVYSRHLDRMKPAKIAEDLGLTPRQVTQALFRANRKVARAGKELFKTTPGDHPAPQFLSGEPPRDCEDEP